MHLRSRSAPSIRNAQRSAEVIARRPERAKTKTERKDDVVTKVLIIIRPLAVGNSADYLLVQGKAPIWWEFL